jgi:hypothetical protein
MDHSKEFRLDTTGGFTSQIKAARRILREEKKKRPRDIDMHKVRTGKTIYFFKNKRRMNAKIKELDDYEYAPPGEKFKTYKT